MQSKLVIASVAAMAHQAIAVSSTSSSQQNSDLGSVLFGYYANCAVQVSNLIGEQSVLDGQLKLSPSFEFTGIDENCPELTATVWMEPPAQCAADGSCPTEGYEIVLDPEQVVNGAWSHDFILNNVSGQWYAHVTVSPYGFECAMAITDGCTEIDVHAPCGAQVTSWSVENSLYTDDSHKAAPIANDIYWTMENLWNCNICATWGSSSSQDTEFVAVQPTFTWDQVRTYAMSDQGAHYRWGTVQTYYPIDYNIAFYDCDTEEVLFQDNKTLEDPYDVCSITTDIEIDKWAEGITSVTNTVNQQPSDTCVAYGITSTITSVGSTIPWNSATQVDSTAQVTVASPPYLIWEELPYTIKSEISHFSERLNAVVGSDTDTAEYWGTCDYSVYMPEFSAVIVEGDSYDDHQIKFTDGTWATSEGICPDFKYTITLYEDDHTFGTWDIIPNEMALATPDAPHQHTTSISVKEATYCMQISMTPEEWYPNQDVPTVYHSRKCQEIIVPECQITPTTTFSGTLDRTTYTMTYRATAKYDELNAWCDPTRLTYEWTSSYNDQPAEDVRDPAALYTSLQDDQQDGLTWTEPESDYEWASTFTVMYAGNADQAAANFSASTTWSHVIGCRPSFAFTPSIEGVEMDDGQLDITILYGLVEYGNCATMWAKYEVFVNGSSTPAYTIDKTDAEIQAFTNTGGVGHTDTFQVPIQSACFQVRLSYGQVGIAATDVMTATDTTCYIPPCIMSDAAVSVHDVMNLDASSYAWAINAGVSTNGWCDVVTESIALYPCTTRQGIFASTPDPVVPGESSQTVLVQNRDFDCTQNLVKAVFTSTTGVQAEANTSHARTSTWTDCSQYVTYSQAVDHTTDSLWRYTTTQAITGESGAICGDAKFKLYSSDSPASNHTYSDVKTKTWNLDSVTGTPVYKATVTYSNLPGEEHELDSVSAPWVQACQLAIEEATFLNFTNANDMTDESATATVKLHAIASGDCGDSFTYNATLDSSTDQIAAYELALTDDIFSDSGMTISQDISRDVQEWKLTFNVKADNAQTPEVHQAMTSGTGFVNQIEDSASSTATSLEDPCSVSVTNATWVSFAEESDWSGDMTSTWRGEITATSECQNIVTSIKLKPGVDAAPIQSFDVAMDDLTVNDDGTYSFEHTFSHPNVQGNYAARVWAHDATNEAVQDDMTTDNNYWDPPCYLEIVNFAKSDQSSSLDHLRTTIDYNLKIAQHGDNACRDTSATIELLNSAGMTFHTALVGDDIVQALTDDGFDLSIQAQAIEADSATAVVSDSRAAEDQTADAKGWTEPNSYTCDVEVIDFCLVNAKEVSTGRWGFDFNIRVESNSKCGTLTASLDLVKDGVFTDNVALDGAEIISAFDCECEKTFTVEADYDGSGNEFYGQMDIRNGQQQIVKITDSCTYEVTA